MLTLYDTGQSSVDESKIADLGELIASFEIVAVDESAMREYLNTTGSSRLDYESLGCCPS